MAQTREGAIKVAAKRIGITVEEYTDKVANGLKWCHKCKSWEPTARFNTDKSRWDGLTAKCQDCTRVKVRVSTKGRTSAFKGKHHSDEAKQAMSDKKKGMQLRLGKPHTVETRIKISQVVRKRTPRGEQCHSYKDGKSKERHGLRYIAEYKRWRFDVYARDEFTCQECGDNKGGNLHAHHIKSFADYPELRFEVSNGITLCKDCHETLHYGKPRK